VANYRIVWHKPSTALTDSEDRVRDEKLVTNAYYINKDSKNQHKSNISLLQ